MTLTHSLFDPSALVIVVTGTFAACAVRCGWRASADAVHAALDLPRPIMDAQANRRAIAQAITAIRQRGALAAAPTLPTDRALAQMVKACLRHNSLAAVQEAGSAVADADEIRASAAARVFATAGELAPVFGLVGTLFGFTQLAPPAGSEPLTAMAGAIATAVLSTLYGALLAHFFCFPLAEAIVRRATDLRQQRDTLGIWFSEQIAISLALHETRGSLRGVA